MGSPDRRSDHYITTVGFIRKNILMIKSKGRKRVEGGNAFHQEREKTAGMRRGLSREWIQFWTC